MTELHRSPNQRRMIAEINTAYQPAFVVMDAMQAFTTAGPDTGTMVEPRLMLAATDRVALDAVGVAVLRHFGTTPEVSQGSIFQQEQIARAVELGIGVGRPGHDRPGYGRSAERGVCGDDPSALAVINASVTISPPIRWRWMICSSTGGSQPAYHAPSG